MKTEINRWLIFLIIGIPLVLIAYFSIIELFNDPKWWVFIIVGILIGSISMILANKIIKK